MYQWSYSKVIIHCKDHRQQLNPKLCPKVRKKIQSECPEGWHSKAQTGLFGVGLYCYDASKLGNLKSEWLEEVEAMLNLITVTV